MNSTPISYFFPYFLAIASNLCFGTASIGFSHFAKHRSSFWINQLKVSVAILGFVLAFLIFEKPIAVHPSALFCLLLSGFLGLCIGDLFLFRAFTTLGAARTLVIYSFEPFLVGIYGFLFLSQSLNFYQGLAIACMIACVLTFLLERNRTTGKWDLHSFAYAFLGVVFDASGIMLTRQAFELTPNLGSFEANSIRAIGAIIGFLALRPASYSKLWKDLNTMPVKTRRLALGSCFLGTFISLSLYLQALKTAHVATLTAIAITGPVWVSLIEHIRDRTWPNRYLWIAFLFFLAGFAWMAFGLRH